MRIQSIELAEWLFNENYFSWIDETISKSKNKDKYTSVKDMHVAELKGKKLVIQNNNGNLFGFSIDCPTYTEIWAWLNTTGIHINVVTDKDLPNDAKWTWYITTKNDPNFVFTNPGATFYGPNNALIDAVQYIKDNFTK